MNDRTSFLRERLQTQLQPLLLDIRDDGAKHIGHAQAGHGHYAVRIVAAAFAAKSPLQRHRMVYAALGDWRQADIHALSIEARSPDETI